MEVSEGKLDSNTDDDTSQELKPNVSVSNETYCGRIPTNEEFSIFYQASSRIVSMSHDSSDISFNQSSYLRPLGRAMSIGRGRHLLHNSSIRSFGSIAP